MIVEKTGRTVESMVGDDLVLMQTDTGLFKSLRHVGLYVWRLLDRTGDPAAIEDLVADRYAVPPSVCTAEVGAFLTELEQAGFVARRAA